MAAPDVEDDTPSLLLLLVDALAFLVRKGGMFLTIVLPIAGIAALVTWALGTQRLLENWRGHWGWDFLFVLIYAMFLDRWLKESLLDGATDCDETDLLRRSIVSPRFLAFAAMLFVVAFALSVLPWVVPLVLCTAIFALLALALPSYSAAEPLGLVQALRLGRSARTTLIVLSAGVALLSVADEAALQWALLHLPPKPWAGPAMAAAQRFFDCVLIALAGHVLAALFRQLADWRQPEPDDHPYRDLMRARRKVPPN
jgi:hypothetical protein